MNYIKKKKKNLTRQFFSGTNKLVKFPINLKFSDIEVTNKTTFRSVYNARRINNEKNEKKKDKKYLKKNKLTKEKGNQK